MPRQYAVLGPLASAVPNHAFLGCVVREGRPLAEEPVVVVWLPDALASDAEALEQLQRRTAWVQHLRHPHIVTVHGLEGFEEGWARIVDFVDGEPLREVARRLRDAELLSPRVVVRIGLDAAAGLQYAHELGEESNGQPIVHGGLRPETLMVGFDGRTRVSGFGASAFRPFRSTIGGQDARAYLAPEQLLGGAESAAPQTDVYGLAAVLFELLTGHAPFAHSEDLERAILTEDLAAPMLPADDQPLMGVLRKALHRKSPLRYPSMADFAADLMDAMSPRLPEDHEELASALEQVFPRTEYAREDRAQLLASAHDPDVVSVLASGDLDPPPATPWEGGGAASWVAPAPAVDPSELTRPAGIETEAIESTSTRVITRFDRASGDGSKYTLVGVALVAAVFIGALFVFEPFTPPEGLETPMGQLPPDLLAEAMAAAAASEERRPPPPPKARGPRVQVRVASRPEADVYDGLDHLGRTPLQTELAAGLHELRFTDASTGLNVYRRLEVVEGRDNEISEVFEPARLHLTAPDGAQVFLNARALGSGSQLGVPVYEGRYLVVVLDDDQHWRQTIQATPGTEIRMQADLQ